MPNYFFFAANRVIFILQKITAKEVLGKLALLPRHRCDTLAKAEEHYKDAFMAGSEERHADCRIVRPPHVLGNCVNDVVLTPDQARNLGIALLNAVAQAHRRHSLRSAVVELLMNGSNTSLATPGRS